MESATHVETTVPAISAASAFRFVDLFAGLGGGSPSIVGTRGFLRVRF